MSKAPSSPRPEAEQLTQAAPLVTAVRPELRLGISVYNEQPDDAIIAALDERFKQCCDVCGVAITRDMRHPLPHKNAWYNACGMCFYAENLDRIPHFKRGKIIYFPDMSQARLNSVLRAIWAIEFLENVTDSDGDYHEMRSSFSELGAMIEGQINITESYFDFSEPDVLSSLLFLIPPQEYAQRWKLFGAFRWLPDRETFEDEMAHWAQQSFHWLHPEKTASNITNFMANYIPDYNIRD